MSGNSENVKNRVGLFLVGGEERTHGIGEGHARPPTFGSDPLRPGGCGRDDEGAHQLPHLSANGAPSPRRCRMGFRAGVKGELLLDAFMRSAADSRQLRNRGPRMVSGDFSNPVSTLDVLTKDIKLGLSLRPESVNANMPLGDLCAPFFTEGQELGFGSLDSAAIYKVFEAREKSGG